MKNIIMAFLCLNIAVHLCAQTKTASTNHPFVLTGRIPDVPAHSKIYLLYQLEGQRKIDSSLVVDHRFQFKGVVPYPVIANLVLDGDGSGLKHLMKKPLDETDALQFYLHPGILKIAGRDSLSTAVFTLSAINRDYRRLQILENIQATHKLIKLSAAMQRERSAAAEKLYVAYYDSLKEARRPVLKRFALQNPKRYIGLMALIEYAGAFPDEKEIRPVFNAMDATVRNTKAGREFNILLNADKTLAIGAIAPDFIQKDTAGNLVRLSALRGRYVLIDFWASWCPSCREANPALVKVYHELKDKNFTILGVSLDGRDSRDAWLRAIKNDGLTWTQVSDLKHWDNAVVKQYGINAIPQNLLIGPDGKIIAKNVEITGIGKQIEQLSK